MNKILFNLLVVGVSLAGIQGASAMDVEGKNINITKKRKSDCENNSQAFQAKPVSRKLYGGSREVESDIYDGYNISNFGEEAQENITEVAIDAIAYANYPQKNTNPYATSRALTAICLNDSIVTAKLAHRYNTRSTAKGKK